MEVLSAVAGVVSALAAAFALWQVANQTKLARREKYYDYFVGGPVVETVKEFRARVLEILSDFERNVAPLRRSDPMLVFKRGKDFMDEVNREYFHLSTLVLGGADAWGEEALRDQFRDRLESLQDEVTTEAERYISGTIGQDLLAAALERNRAAILRVVREGDPGTVKSRLKLRFWRRT